ncbi:MAG: hypothetical protein JST00_37930 [Deltaproteobacteria bacterium]|nr:hypothetical protein [Deltaproteobacteria bacterium]
MGTSVCFLVAVADRRLRERLAGMLGRYGTVLRATSLGDMKRTLERRRTIQVLVTERPLPDGDPIPVVRRFTKSKLAVSVPAAVIVSQLEACDAREVEEIERLDAYVLDDTMIDERLVPILADRWRRDFAGLRGRLREDPAPSLDQALERWRSRFGLTAHQCALLRAAAGPAPSSDREGAESPEAVADLLRRTRMPSYRVLLQRFLAEVLGEPIPARSRSRRSPAGASRARKVSGASSRS